LVTSATTAPTSAAAAPIFMLAKKNGALAGARSFMKVCARVAE
jgi:hypothetical protein